MGNLSELFEGIPVVIDDEIGAGTDIDTLILNLEKENCHVLKLIELPKQKAIKNLDGASFIILDWEFKKLPEETQLEGVKLGQGLKEKGVEENIEFLTELKKVQFLPIFIFTNTNVDSVKQILKDKELIKDDGGDHIFVMDKKSVLTDGLFPTLEAWVKGHPSAYVLKKWNKAYTEAKNSLFNDFYENSRYWPVVIWETHDNDGVPPASELGNLIARNIDSRMSPVDFDTAMLTQLHNDKIDGISADEIKKVLAGERFIEDKFLDKNSYSIGDLFKKNTKKYFINIRPECDCVVRDGGEVDSAKLYLLPGTPVKDGKLDWHEKYGIREPDNASIMFAIHEGKTLKFDFQDLEIMSAQTLKSEPNNYSRVGRLISPYITRLMQRYAAYSHRSGLPKVPLKAYPPQKQPECTKPCNIEGDEAQIGVL
jgi:hypothetical protein